MAISQELAKKISDFVAFLTPKDLETIERNVVAFKKQAIRLASKPPTGCTMGRWEDRDGMVPNEVVSDDANP